MNTKEKTKELHERGFVHASLVSQVLEMHRKSNYWSLWDKAEEICEKLNKIPKHIVQESLKIYESNKKDGKYPHPNYFLAIVARLLKQESEKTEDSKFILGRTV